MHNECCALKWREFLKKLHWCIVWAGFLLRAGNRLFIPTVQVNVTGYFTETQKWNLYWSYPTIFPTFWKNISCLLSTNVVKICITCYWFHNTSYVEDIWLVLTKFIPCSHLEKWPQPCFLSILHSFCYRMQNAQHSLHTHGMGEGDKATCYLFSYPL